MASFSVVNNIPGLVAQQQATANEVNLNKTLFRLSSGLRINTGGDDAAGLAIADGLRAQVRTLQQSVRNANDGIGFLQTADSGLGQVTNLLNRAASLLDQAASDTNSDGEVAIETELAQIFQEIDRIGVATKFNGVTVFSDTTRNIFVGDTQNLTAAGAQISFTTSALSVAGLSITSGVSGTGTSIAVDITTSVSAAAILVEVEAAIDTVAASRGRLGSKSNRLENAVGLINAQIQNLSSAESQLRDANIAEETSNLTKFQILQQTGLAAIAQANVTPQAVLSLLG